MEIHSLHVMITDSDSPQIDGCLNTVDGVDQVIKILIEHRLYILAHQNGHVNKEILNGKQESITN